MTAPCSVFLLSYFYTPTFVPCAFLLMIALISNHPQGNLKIRHTV